MEKRRAWLGTILGVLLTAAAWGAAPNAAAPVAKAPSLPPGLAAMQTWLADLDGGEYARCWNEAGKLMQQSVPLQKWLADSNRRAQTFGACAHRQLTGAQRHDRFRPANGPAVQGEFIEAEFATDFEKQKGITEHLSSMKEPDGVWRVFAYDARIVPAPDGRASP